MFYAFKGSFWNWSLQYSRKTQKQHLKDRVYIVYSEVTLNKMFTSIITTIINILDVINSCTLRLQMPYTVGRNDFLSVYTS